VLWTVVLPGALLPSTVAADVLAGAAAPWLTQVLARALAEPAEYFEPGGAPHLSWLWRRYGGTGDPVTAPYALCALDEHADLDAQCWHVDPVHFAFARDHLVLMPLDEPPAPAEGAALAAHLQTVLEELLVDATPKLHRHGERWLLTLARPWSLQATPFDGALGQPVHEHWPTGRDATFWRRLLNEIQMRWHVEASNEERESRGVKPVNALWLHGGGFWAALPAKPFATVADPDAVLRGWALASGVPRAALHDEAADTARGDTVCVRRDLLLPAQFEAWGQWLDRLARLDASLRSLQQTAFAAGYNEMALVLCGRQQARVVRLRRGDSWKLWRRAPLAPLLAEAE